MREDQIFLSTAGPTKGKSWYFRSLYQLSRYLFLILTFQPYYVGLKIISGLL